jgi:signal transduction histidine kinase
MRRPSYKRVPFRPQARLLLLLGEQLIRDPGLAVFELVKNAYDADSPECSVLLEDCDDVTRGKITVRDKGSGMTADVLENVWLSIGTDYRATQRAADVRTPVFNRFPLGEKGVGRLAAHKLGRKITLVTRSAGKREVVLRVNWDRFVGARDLQDVRVIIRERQPKVFTGDNHGTCIEVSRLREPWTKAKVRALHRSVSSLRSPFNAPSDFAVTMSVEPQADWLEGLLEVKDVIRDALYHASGWMEATQFHFNYRFRPYVGMRHLLEPITTPVTGKLARKAGREVEPVDLSKFKIGRVNFQFHMFDLEPSVVDLATSDKRGLRSYLKANGGIRIYRDGMRVFDFGEPGNDWLNLDVRRVNKPVVRVSNNQLLGALMLDASASSDLIEKTNREGFIENDAFELLRDAVIWTLTQVEAERQKDQKNVRTHYSRQGPQKPVIDQIDELRDALDRRGLLKDFEQQVDGIEKQFNEVQSILLTAAAPGLTFAVVIHQAEKVLKELVRAVDEKMDPTKVKQLVHQLSKMMEGLTFLIRKSGFAKEKASTLIAQTIFNNELRFKAHQIQKTNGLETGNPDFSIKCVRRLVVATLVNLVDNSIYWLESTGQKDRQIYLGTTFELDDKPSFVVADNGPGFRDDPDSLVQPFFSRRPDGMGLGLYTANEVAKQHQGRLLFPQPGDVKLPDKFKGAIIALQFPKTA